MANSRTKQQIAFDGVRTAWHSDAFTQILHAQVTTKFPMDGVVPSEDAPPVTVVREAPKAKSVRTIEGAQKKIVNIVGTMDGIRKQLKPARAT
jgi:hypothetical protein